MALVVLKCIFHTFTDVNLKLVVCVFNYRSMLVLDITIMNIIINISNRNGDSVFTVP